MICHLKNSNFIHLVSILSTVNFISKKNQSVYTIKKEFLFLICKVEVEEKNDIIKQLRLNLKCKEEELDNVQKKLRDAQNQFEKDLKRLCTELADARSQTKEMGKKLKLERDTFSDKMITVCDKLREAKCAFDEAKCVINIDLLSVKSTVAEIMKRIKGGESKYDKIELQVKKLIEENCHKDESLLQINKKIEELQRNECNVFNMHRQINKLQEWKSKIERDEKK